MTIVYTLIGIAIMAFVYWRFIRIPRIPPERLQGRQAPKLQGDWSADDRGPKPGPFKTFIASIASLQNDETNAIWKEWIDFQPRDIRAFREVVHGRFRLEFKQRALLVLLAPHTDLVPVYLPKSFERDRIDDDCLDDLPRELHEFAVTLIEVSLDAIDKRGTEGKNKLFDYQSCIETLFSQVSENHRERLYKRFLLRDVFAYWDMDDFSGYHPWTCMMYANIGEAWKRRMDADMRAIVLREMQGKAAPRAEHEDAFCFYVSKLTTMAYGKPYYSAELYADQFAFALSLAEQPDLRGYKGRTTHKALRSQYVCRGRNLQRVLRHLDRETFADLRQRLIANAWKHDDNRNLHGEFLEAARQQLAEIHDSHPDIAEIIQAAIAEGEQKEKEDLTAQQAREQERKAVEQQMLRKQNPAVDQLLS